MRATSPLHAHAAAPGWAVGRLFLLAVFAVLSQVRKFYVFLAPASAISFCHFCQSLILSMREIFRDGRARTDLGASRLLWTWCGHESRWPGSLSGLFE